MLKTSLNYTKPFYLKNQLNSKIYRPSHYINNINSNQ